MRRSETIGAFAGVVAEDGAGLVPFAGPSGVEPWYGERLPPPGTEVPFSVVRMSGGAEPARFYAVNVRRAR
ncbi:MAG TPA: hypothetical protein VGD94_19250 [Vicinamibacterales bacterium]